MKISHTLSAILLGIVSLSAQSNEAVSQRTAPSELKNSESKALAMFYVPLSNMCEIAFNMGDKKEAISAKNVGSLIIPDASPEQLRLNFKNHEGSQIVVISYPNSQYAEKAFRQYGAILSECGDFKTQL